MATTLQRVWKVLDAWCDLPSGPIQPNLKLDDLDMDSLRRAEISLALDKEFTASIPDSKIKNAKTIADLAALIDAHTATIRKLRMPE
ncbi:acyl carrier protein [Nocardia brevicatena]|uniref:acyl carrier protein n=1 Tax=Nocardia brevicatena TaxID=37327 RepID=UPI0002DDD5DF|nr:acyl carrier protein [Nocardia brevicatena]